MTKKKKSSRKTKVINNKDDLMGNVAGFLYKTYPGSKNIPSVNYLWTDENSDGSEFHKFRVNWLDSSRMIVSSTFVVLSIVDGQKSFEEK